MRLYEINNELAVAINQYTECTDEAELQALAEVIGNLGIQFEDKVIACGFYCVNQGADIEAIDSEISRLKAMKQSKENAVERLKQYIKTQMEFRGTDKVESPTLKVAIRKNPISVIVDSEEEVPMEYKRTKTIVEVDKRAIAETHKKGIGVAGTHTEQKTRLDIR